MLKVNGCKILKFTAPYSMFQSQTNIRVNQKEYHQSITFKTKKILLHQLFPLFIPNTPNWHQMHPTNPKPLCQHCKKEILLRTPTVIWRVKIHLGPRPRWGSSSSDMHSSSSSDMHNSSSNYGSSIGWKLII